jgi:molecular chaperone GrpE
MPEGDRTDNIDKIEEELKEEKEKKNEEEINKEEKEFEGMEALINAIEEEKEEFKDKYLRALANYENLRKRAIQERQKSYELAHEELFRKILPILDDFKRAFESFNKSEKHKDDYKSFYEGIRLVRSNFENLLKIHNVEPFESLGEKFDPSKHEAIHVIEHNDQEEGKILEETECGYKIRDRVLRPAKVIVAKRGEENKDKNNEENKNEGGKEE